MALGACAQPTSAALTMTQSASDEVTVTAVLDIWGIDLEPDGKTAADVPKTLSFEYRDTVDGVTTSEQKTASLSTVSSADKVRGFFVYTGTYRLEWTETVPSGEKYQGCLRYKYQDFVLSEIGLGGSVKTLSAERCASIEFPERTTTTTSMTKPGQTTTTSSTTQPIVIVIPGLTTTTTTTATTTSTSTSTTTTSSTTTTVPVGPTTTVPGPPVCLPGDPPPCP
jgi:hypothetical protein